MKRWILGLLTLLVASWIDVVRPLGGFSAFAAVALCATAGLVLLISFLLEADARADAEWEADRDRLHDHGPEVRSK